MRKNKSELESTREYKRLLGQSFFMIKPIKWFVQYKLTSSETDVMAIILAFQRSKGSNGWYSSGITGLQVYLFKSRDSIINIINKLKAKKLIEQREFMYRVVDRAIDFEVTDIKITTKNSKSSEIKKLRAKGHKVDINKEENIVVDGMHARLYTQEDYEKFIDDIDNIKI